MLNRYKILILLNLKLLSDINYYTFLMKNMTFEKSFIESGLNALPLLKFQI